jgi:hypothetical protein
VRLALPFPGAGVAWMRRLLGSVPLFSILGGCYGFAASRACVRQHPRRPAFGSSARGGRLGGRQAAQFLLYTVRP